MELKYLKSKGLRLFKKKENKKRKRAEDLRCFLSLEKVEVKKEAAEVVEEVAEAEEEEVVAVEVVEEGKHGSVIESVYINSLFLWRLLTIFVKKI